METLVFMSVLLPLFAFVFGSLGKTWLEDLHVQIMTTGSVILSAIFSAVVFYGVCYGGVEPFSATLYTWIKTTHLTADFGIMVDPLSATMLMVVSMISACVHVYSWGYMDEDKSKARFFSYLSFFTFTMLALVTAPNLLQMFLGWEGVGLASYLLIGFWIEKESAIAAGMKAFITNRVADLGLLLALFITFMLVGSLDYADIFAAIPLMESVSFTGFGLNVPVVEVIALCLLIGAMGKSAQLGFHVWLPDAMEGPTPVSALIHAATMVTAGVFLLARMSPIFEQAEAVLMLVTIIGALTAIFAAAIGLTQRDIKRVIAYSTCSQLGYMFMACGVSAYAAAMFHLTTHAFFKALLFLGAGAVIHGLQHQQDLFKMGALRKVFPATYVLMWLGSLALMGVPPFAGFFSKDLILESALMSGEWGWLFYTLGVTAALMTAFYSLRLMFLAFAGDKSNVAKVALIKAHEAPRNMLWPMYVLGAGAVAGGLLFHSMVSTGWWQGAIAVAEHHTALLDAHHAPWPLKFLPLVIVGIGAFLALKMYIWQPALAKMLSEKFSWPYKISFNKFYVDELFYVAFVYPIKWLGVVLWRVVDLRIIDNFGPNGAAFTTRLAGLKLRLTQTGLVYHYAFVLLIGVCAFLSWLMFKAI